jgi:uncharacterized membrane protein
VTVIGLNLRLSRRSLALILVPLAIVVVLSLGISFHQQIKNQLIAWKLLPEPEKLTELYFMNPNNLPTIYTPGQKQYVHFTVHNIEYQNETYSYKIVEQNQDGSQIQLLSSGQFTLQQNQYQGLNVGVSPADLGTRAEIIIELPTVNENISYLVNRTGA